MASRTELLAKIHVLAELEHMGIPVKFGNTEEVLVKCPYKVRHEDKNPSCSINLTKRLFKCHSCQADGDFITFMATAMDEPRRLVVEHLTQRYGGSKTSGIDRSLIEKYHQDLFDAPPLLQELYVRGITDEAIRKYRLGRLQSRIIVPIFDEHGECINLRKYLPGAPAREKFKGLAKRGAATLYPIDQLKFDKLIVCGGELKAVAAAIRLNEFGIGAITSTGGEGSWSPTFNEKIAEKEIIICLDIDDAGQLATEALCARLFNHVPILKTLTLPLERSQYPKGDLSDYFGQEGKTGADFVVLLETAVPWAPTKKETTKSGETISVAFQDIVKPEHTTRRLKVDASVAAMVTTPYTVPSEVRCQCNRDQEFCGKCPVFYGKQNDDSTVDLAIAPDDIAILSMVATNSKNQRDAVRRGLGIPPCKPVQFTPLTYHTVEEVMLIPKMDIAARHTEMAIQPAYCVGHGLELNEAYELRGKPVPHPKSQQIVYLCDERKALQDSLYDHTTNVKGLNIFQPREWTVDGISDKLDALYYDFASNVTRIFRRSDLHLAVDLGYHSPLLLSFDGRVTKGWSEILILGDSSQGKSEVSRSLMEHYGLGTKVDCKNATIAGLIGGAQKISERWMITWGIIPNNDRRLVILEELKGASTEVIGKLTEMRSSGIAELPKIEKRRTHARTRLVCISNPRRDVPIDSYSFGIEAIRELIGSLEDIRRFDLCLLVSSKQVDAGEIISLSANRPLVSHTHSPELCRSLILWAWTRTSDQVKFEPAALEAATLGATKLANKFSEAVPIIDRGSTRHKLARLAAALAARTFSVESDTLIVRACHVDFIVQFLDRVYSDPICGYEEFSTAVKMQSEILDEGSVRKKILAAPHPQDFITQLFHAESIEFRDIRDWCAWDVETTLEFISFMVRKHALLRDGRAYRKNSRLNTLLKEMRKEGVERPAHIVKDSVDF